MKKIEYRKPDRKERGDIYHILIDALSLDKFLDDDTVKVDFAKWVYWNIMEKHACIRIAKTRDSIVGLVAAPTTDNRKAVGSWLKKNGTWLGLKCRGEGRKILNLYKELEEGRKQSAAESDGTFGYLAVLWVSPTYKGKQIEEQFLKEVQSYFAERNISEMRVILNNFSDHSFYQKIGFEKKSGQKFMIEPKGQRFRLNQELYVKEMNDLSKYEN